MSIFYNRIVLQIYLIIKITWGYCETFFSQPLPMPTELEFPGQGFIFYDSGSLSVVSRSAASASPGNCSKCKLAHSTPDLLNQKQGYGVQQSVL